MAQHRRAGRLAQVAHGVHRR
ncbi:hypothetical protein ACLB1G_03160 [Oxalobacteraceae bacterium A2-2]